MNYIEISQLNKKLIVRFSNQTIELPVEWQEKIDTHWQSLIDSGKTYTRGEVFTVTKNREENDTYQILVEKTDYAHYLYCQNIDPDMDGYGIRVIFTSCLVETLDNKTIFGIMGEHTARSGIYQLAGGGIGNSDIKDGIFDLKGSIANELREELDIDIDDIERVKEFDEAYIKQGGKTKKIAVVYRVRLNETADEFVEKYDAFAKELNKNGEKPEFGNIVILDKTNKTIHDFFNTHRNECDEYMEPLLTYAYSQ